MKQDNAHITRIDRGWDKMQGILEKEMPEKKKDKRRVFFWLIFIGLALSLLAGQFFSTDKTDTNLTSPVRHDDAHNYKVLDASKNPHTSQSEIVKDNGTNIDQQEHSKQIPGSADVQLPGEKSNQSDGQLTSIVINKTETTSNKVIAKSKPKKIHSESETAKPSPVVINKQKLDEPFLSNDLAIHHDNAAAYSEPALNESTIGVIKRSERTSTGLQALIPLELSEPIIFNYNREINLNFQTAPVVRQIEPVKNKPIFFTAVSAHGILATSLNYKGWNAGLNVGLKKNRVSYSVFGRYACIQRSLMERTEFIAEPGTSEDDLTNMFDTMMVGTVLVEENITEKIYYIETGLSVDYNIAKGLYLNLSPGIDYMFKNNTSVNGKDVSAGVSNPSSPEFLYVPSELSHKVVPFVSGGLSLRLANGLFFNSYYKRQFSSALERPSGVVSLNQYHAGLKFEF